MATCDYCKSTILFGGAHVGDLKFCNDTCKAPDLLVLEYDCPVIRDEQDPVVRHGFFSPRGPDVQVIRFEADIGTFSH